MIRIPRRRQHGIVLLDALIAILIFAIGILGIVKLQSNAVGFASDAKFRSDAAMLADQAIGRMWASDQTTLSTAYVGSAGSGGAGYNAWNTLVSGALPSGVGTIVVDAATVATVTVAWANPSDGQAHTYISVTQISK